MRFEVEFSGAIPLAAKLEVKPQTMNTEMGQVMQVDSKVEIDPVPTEGSENAVSSGGVFEALKNVDPIIDVLELPTNDINERALYRVLTGTFIYNQFKQNGFTCYCVNGLPETGEPCTNAEMSAVVGYYNAQDGICYGYLDAALSSVFGYPVGWYDISALFTVAGWKYGGVITNIEDGSAMNTFYLLLEYKIYSYMATWETLKGVGQPGAGASAEVFNHPTNIASGDASHAEGNNTIASGKSQHVQGEWNVEDPAPDATRRGTYAHIVGNGSNGRRSNAHTLDWNGTAWFAGDVYVGSTGGKNKDEGSVRLATLNDLKESGVQFETDETLSLKDGVLSVNRAFDVKADNTLPITSAAVATTVGNIEVLLKTI